jgi:ribose-phosphate pyrophosphokinase
MIIVGCSNSPKLGLSLSRKVKCSYLKLEKKHFPDGELYIRFKKSVKGQHVVLVQSFHPNPQEALVEIIWAAETARDLGAKKVTLVAPYLGFMRQDKRFNAGEAVSAKIAGKLIGNYVDKVVTVDPHAHRIRDLQSVFGCKFVSLTSNGAIAGFIKKNLKCDVVVGPDAESYQWAEAIAKHVGVKAVVLRKKRHSSRSVKVRFVEQVDFKGKAVVITDDIISTGHTMVEAVKAAKKKGAKSVVCVGVHGVFVEDAVGKMRKVGAGVITTDTIENEQAKIDVAALIAEAL